MLGDIASTSTFTPGLVHAFGEHNPTLYKKKQAKWLFVSWCYIFEELSYFNMTYIDASLLQFPSMF